MEEQEFRDAVCRLPEVDALPWYWAAAHLVREAVHALPLGDIPTSVQGLESLLELTCEELLDADEPGPDSIDAGAALLWRSVPTERRGYIAGALFCHIWELMEEAG